MTPFVTSSKIGKLNLWFKKAEKVTPSGWI
jgi:hypothetical protein